MWTTTAASSSSAADIAATSVSAAYTETTFSQSGNEKHIAFSFDLRPTVTKCNSVLFKLIVAWLIKEKPNILVCLTQLVNLVIVGLHFQLRVYKIIFNTRYGSKG